VCSHTRFRATLCLLFLLGLPGLASADRPQLGPGQTNAQPRPSLRQIQVQEATLDQILQCLIGPDAEVSNAVLTGVPGSTGTLTGGSSIIGLDEGLILSSGNIVTLVGPNLSDDTSYDNGLPGDADLDALIPGYSTFDATILEFDFECPDPTVISFQYVFASEEYNEWVASPYNDVFGFFLNGTNIALTPDACSGPGIPVAINNVNCENPYLPPNGPNCDCYRNNDLSDGGGLIDTEMDGLTQVFYATAEILPGTNHLKLAIADAGDQVLDSNVILHCQSFTCAPPPATGACCFSLGDDDCFFLSEAQCLAQGGTYQGDGVPCSPVNPCDDDVSVGDVPRDASSLALSVVPNPSTGRVLISYQLTQPAEVTVEVFDVSGSLVRRLSQGNKPAGLHTVPWDGLDRAAQALSPGIYFVRIRIPEGTATERLVLVK
jgi:hypothetical protein